MLLKEDGGELIILSSFFIYLFLQLFALVLSQFICLIDLIHAI